MVSFSVRKQFLKAKPAKKKHTEPKPEMTGPKPEKAFVDRINDLAESWKARLGPWRNNTKNTRPLLIASDCSGYGSDVIALRLLGLHREVRSVMTCEKDAVKVALHRAVSECCGIAFDETAHHSDIFDRQDIEFQRPHLYTAGYPCPSYSRLGKKKGTQDRRGLVTLRGLEFVSSQRPQVVVLEQVSAILEKRFSKVWNFILKILGKLNYSVDYKVMNTKSSGLPQSRPRVYVVAVAVETVRQQVNLKLPTARSDRIDLHTFLDKSKVGSEVLNLPHYHEKLGDAMWRKGYILDIGASPKFQHPMFNVSPCLTYSRCKSRGFYIPKLRRRLLIEEAARLQGVPQQVLKAMLTQAQKQKFGDNLVFAALGDAMSINVLCLAIALGLESAGLANLESKRAFWLKCPADKCYSLSDNLFEKGAR